MHDLTPDHSPTARHRREPGRRAPAWLPLLRRPRRGCGALVARYLGLLLGAVLTAVLLGAPPAAAITAALLGAVGGTALGLAGGTR